jgi:hypothetical protein
MAEMLLNGHCSRVTAALSLCLMACGTDQSADGIEPSADAQSPSDAGAELEGFAYLDNVFTGEQTPVQQDVEVGQHIAGIITPEHAYHRREFTATEMGKVDIADTVGSAPASAAKDWKLLVIFAEEIDAEYTDSSGAKVHCNAKLSAARSEAMTNNFMVAADAVAEYSAGLVNWQVTVRHQSTPIEELYRLNGPSHYVLLEEVEASLVGVQRGDYDAIFVVYSPYGDGCQIPAEYFGVFMGNDLFGYGGAYLNVRDVSSVNWSTYDGNVWRHEWMHSLEFYYGELGVKLPSAAEGQSPLHTAEEHGYSAPWGPWQRDFLLGRVAEEDGYRGIGPENLLLPTLREAAVQP